MAEENKKNDEDKDEINIDFSKIKNFFSGKKEAQKEKTKIEAEEKTEAKEIKEAKRKTEEEKDEEEISIDLSKIKSIFKGKKARKKINLVKLR